MKLVAFIMAVTAVLTERFEPGLRVKFGVGPGVDKTHSFDLPRTTTDAAAGGWEPTSRPLGPLPQLVMYCPADKVMCCLYDDTGYVAGVQVALTKFDFSENVFEWEKRGFTSWNTTIHGKYKDFWTQQIYFVDDVYLAINQEERLSSRDYSRTLQTDAVWVTGINKEVLKVSNQEKDIIREQLFTKQACFPGMGQHYVYNLSTETKCSYDQMYPWFLMFTNGELSGTAFITFGKLIVPCCSRNWYERPALPLIKAIVPYGPPCVYDLITNPGALTMHVFFVDRPWDITCPA